MTDLTEQEVCIGSLGQQKVYLCWSDVKDICTNAVSEAYEQARKENTKLKELLKRARNLMNYTKDWACSDATEEMITKIDQALGEE